ncbi:MAG: glutathione S-transferase family protein [Pseudomonadota bacterium]
MMFKSLKLYHYPLTRSVRVKWMLHEVLDEGFEVEVVPVIRGAMQTPDMLAKNPNHNLPMLDITWADGSEQTMLESGAMVLWLADAFLDKQLAPPVEATQARADYLQMILFNASWMDMILWQIRLHRDLLPNGLRQTSIVEMNTRKWAKEIEPQLAERLNKSRYICGDQFTAADCISGHNVRWAQSYGLCEGAVFQAYLDRLATRPAYISAYSDADQFGQ